MVFFLYFVFRIRDEGEKMLVLLNIGCPADGPYKVEGEGSTKIYVYY